jgi:2-polyprenyl-3-methyl-5-hydroxy-6-metoxy-1,4-benzoquinol methylase
MFVNPRPSKEEVRALYADERTNPYFSDTHEPLKLELPVLKQVLQQVRQYVPGGELLEIGCGRGDFLRISQCSGFSVSGCDIFGGHIPEVSGATLYDGTLSEVNFPENAFDVVVMRNVLEHVFDPETELKEIRRILKPNGYLYVKVPNVAFEYGLKCRLVFGREHTFDPPYHLNYFRPHSLKTILEKNGFHLISWLLEQPTLNPSRRIENFVRQAGFRAIQWCYILSGGRAFPKIVLACAAKKMAYPTYRDR